MARPTTHVRHRVATAARVGRTRSGSANEPTRSQLDARTELRSQAARALAQIPELGPCRRSDDWAIRYLESSRSLGPTPAPLSPADQIKITSAQAEMVAHVITAVLDGLGLSDEVWYQGSEIAMRELAATTPEDWSPL
jgi:hypothetical protein